ncbi:MAG: YnfA family protein [Pyrinomonadaceae bacterium]
MNIVKSGFFLLFLGVAALFELLGVYLFWKVAREHANPLLALIGVAALIVYALTQTVQPENFSRVYAAYGGIFIFLSLLWGYLIERKTPDKFDLIGGIIAIAGACIIKFWPRG